MVKHTQVFPGQQMMGAWQLQGKQMTLMTLSQVMH
jgi:hypothetical protein|tara:strand:+ start:695 stop:799 length:105 start_codon:yes stop_codon:yes gene_type:complete